jgi:hypothetical protein
MHFIDILGIVIIAILCIRIVPFLTIGVILFMADGLGVSGKIFGCIFIAIGILRISYNIYLIVEEYNNH